MIFFELFIGFLRVGLFSFGGAYAAIPLIRDIVLEYGWTSEDMLTDMIAVSESTPGPIMINLATYIGSTTAGLPGAVLATAAVVLPSFLVILLISAFLKNALKNRYLQSVLDGMKPCMIGIILATGFFMILRNCFSLTEQVRLNVTEILLTVILSAVYFGSRILKIGKNGLSPIFLILLAAVGGVIAYGIG